MTGIDFSNSFESGSSIFERQPGKGVATRLVIDGRTGQVCQMLPVYALLLLPAVGV